MKALSREELDKMRQAQREAMGDTCVLECFTPGMDDYGTELETYTAGDPIPCGFNPESGGKREYRRADGTIAVIDASLRLALDEGETLDARDRVRLTHRHGEPLSQPLVFGLDGPPQIGPTGVVLRLVRVE